VWWTDLSLIRQRIDEGDYYRSKEMLHADLMRMTRNCKTYNNMDTPFYRSATQPRAHTLLSLSV
jgi:hypothetical protein